MANSFKVAVILLSNLVTGPSLMTGSGVMKIFDYKGFNKKSRNRKYHRPQWASDVRCTSNGRLYEVRT